MPDVFKWKRNIIVISGPGYKPQETAGYLIENGISEATPAVVCESLSLEDEKIFRGTLREISKGRFSWLSLMVVPYPTT